MPQKPGSLASPARRWLWHLRITAALSTLPLCYMLLQTLGPAFRDPCGDEPGPLLGVVIPLTVPYLHILFEVRRRPRKRGMALAVVTGSFWFLIGALNLWVLLVEGKVAYALVIGLLTLAQAGMVVSAMKTYYTIGREPGDRRTLMAWGFGAFAIYAGGAAFWASALPSLTRSRQGASEASAVGSLRTHRGLFG